ncbi:MAG: CHAP domain-containing protein [Bacteroidales bacterium]|nr:CHAP domain-containing protein [Bacteroidales bacterium]
MKRKGWIILVILLLIIGLFYITRYITNNQEKKIIVEYNVGEPIDSLNGVVVYFNGKISNSHGRNTIEGYNIGLKYQCVEFVKRYYFEYYNHKMPDTWGHAKDFYDKDLTDGELNTRRDLFQYSNPSKMMPEVGDLLVWDGTHGHVAIISEVRFNRIEVIQQNCWTISRRKYKLKFRNGWYVDNSRILGWLRKYE